MMISISEPRIYPGVAVGASLSQKKPFSIFVQPGPSVICPVIVCGSLLVPPLVLVDAEELDLSEPAIPPVSDTRPVQPSNILYM